jgi:predicted deacylase
LIKTLISRIIDVFERVIFYFKDFAVNLHTKGSGEKYGCTRAGDPSWPSDLLYTVKRDCVTRVFASGFFHESQP